MLFTLFICLVHGFLHLGNMFQFGIPEGSKIGRRDHQHFEIHTNDHQAGFNLEGNKLTAKVAQGSGFLYVHRPGKGQLFPRESFQGKDEPIYSSFSGEHVITVQPDDLIILFLPINHISNFIGRIKQGEFYQMVQSFGNMSTAMEVTYKVTPLLDKMGLLQDNYYTCIAMTIGRGTRPIDNSGAVTLECEDGDCTALPNQQWSALTVEDDDDEDTVDMDDEEIEAAMKDMDHSDEETVEMNDEEIEAAIKTVRDKEYDEDTAKMESEAEADDDGEDSEETEEMPDEEISKFFTEEKQVAKVNDRLTEEEIQDLVKRIEQSAAEYQASEELARKIASNPNYVESNDDNRGNLKRGRVEEEGTPRKRQRHR